MRFTITASTATREVRFERDSLLGALEQALRLSSSGMGGVCVTDSRGRSHSPAELSRRLLEAGPDGQDRRADPLAA